MRVFLTGATGYVGSHVAGCLIDAGHELAIAVRGERDDAQARRLGAWPIRVALTDLAKLRGIAGEVDAIAHCAASDRPDFQAVNAAAIEAMLAGLRPGCGFVMQGGTLVFGDTRGAEFDGTEAFAPPPPLAERAELDASVLRAGRERGLRAAIAYAAFVYGAGEGAVLPSLLIRAALATGHVGVPDGADPVWSTVHIADWAALIAAAVARAPAGGTPLVAAGAPCRIRDVATLAAGALGLPCCAVRPEAAVGVWGPMGSALFASQHFTAERTTALVGWSAIEDSLQEEVEALACGFAQRCTGSGRA